METGSYWNNYCLRWTKHGVLRWKASVGSLQKGFPSLRENGFPFGTLSAIFWNCAWDINCAWKHFPDWKWVRFLFWVRKICLKIIILYLIVDALAMSTKTKHLYWYDKEFSNPCACFCASSHAYFFRKHDSCNPRSYTVITYPFL